MKKKNNSLLKSEFSRFCNNNNVIEEDGFEKMASVLNIDMYSDVSYYINFIYIYIKNILI